MDASEVEYVGFWSRFGASLIDTLLLLMVTVPLLVSVYGWEYFNTENPALVVGPADFIISWVLPFALTVLFWSGLQATPGKMVVSARVVDARTGGNISVAKSVGRYLGYFVSMLPFGLGFLWIAFDPKKQGWHDKMAGTVVVRPKHAGVQPVKFDG